MDNDKFKWLHEPGVFIVFWAPVPFFGYIANETITSHQPWGLTSGIITCIGAVFFFFLGLANLIAGINGNWED